MENVKKIKKSDPNAKIYNAIVDEINKLIINNEELSKPIHRETVGTRKFYHRGPLSQYQDIINDNKDMIYGLKLSLKIIKNLK